MAKLPCGQEVGFALIKRSDQGGERSQEGWGSRGKRSGSRDVGRFNNKGEENGRDESDDGEDDERKRAYAADVAERVFRSRCIGFRMVAKVDLTDPGGRVEEEWEPTC